MRTRLLRIITAVNILLISLSAYSQTPSTTLVDDIIEDSPVDNIADEEYDWSEQIERLTELREQPLNLNSATREELEQFSFLTPQQVEGIQEYITIHGEMKSVSELMLVNDMDRNTIRLLTPFVCAKPVDKSVSEKLAEMLRYGKHEAVARFDIPFYHRQGYDDAYHGSPNYHSVKYKFRYKNKISFGISGENDPGEPFGGLCNKKGYDYYSAHLLITDIGLLKTLVVGDYGLSFGQGLVVNTDFSLDNSSFLFSSPFLTRGISKHSSNGESNYFCGGAATIEPLKGLTVSPFYSRRLIDGKVDSDGNLTSISTTGLHRTTTEISRKNSTSLQTTGANIQYHKSGLNVGVTAIYYWLNRNYTPDLSGYRKFNIHGNNFYNVGLSYGYSLKRFTLLGEMAKGKRGVAFINKLRYDHSGSFNLMLLHRYYSHYYWNMFANSFSRGSSVSNENGWFAAANIVGIPRVDLYASLDLYAFPWKKYRISHGSYGTDGNLRATYTLARCLSLSGEYRLRKRDRDKTGSSGEEIYTYMQHRWRTRLTYQPGDNFNARTTAEYNIFHINGLGSSTGYRITQSVTLRTARERLRLQPQFTYFRTGDYDSRVFVAESGMLYSGYSQSFYGNGIRWSLNVRYAINRHFTAMCKLSQTHYFDRDEIGSGNDLIESSRKSDLQMLIQYKF
jgi:hypothetical protein